ncbi:MAG: hypothetical protein ACI9MC_002695 [Kiritimatiellia bacterium]
MFVVARGDVPNALTRISYDADALWIVPDNSLWDSTLLSTAFRIGVDSQVAVASYSRDHLVTSQPAVFAIEADSAGLRVGAAEIARTLLSPTGEVSQSHGAAPIVIGSLAGLPAAGVLLEAVQADPLMTEALSVVAALLNEGRGLDALDVLCLRAAGGGDVPVETLVALARERRAHSIFKGVFSAWSSFMATPCVPSRERRLRVAIREGDRANCVELVERIWRADPLSATALSVHDSQHPFNSPPAPSVRRGRGDSHLRRVR